MAEAKLSCSFSISVFPARLPLCSLHRLTQNSKKEKWEHRHTFEARRFFKQAIKKAREDYPGINIVGWHHGYFGMEEEEAIVAEICRLQPALLLVALGVPRQEKWIARYRLKLPPCVTMGVGGSFDVLAGHTRRAPLWMQRAGLEWFYRLLKEPSRFKRMAVLPLFLLAVLCQAVQGTKG
jgi:N-acetylglucosaminyldiphosphoundecaprenol N-acetyl-beta-D-mannosaminyltransferase